MSFQRSFKPFPWMAACFSALGVLALGADAGRAQMSVDDFYRDIWQTLQARKLILDDPQLGPLNIGVKVTNRVAVLWGPIPSGQLSFRAEGRLRTMFELIEIRNCLTIELDDNAPADRPLVPAVPQLLPEPLSPVLPNGPRRPLVLPQQRVELAGIEVSVEGVTARSSPLEWSSAAPDAGPVTLRLPFLGSVMLPR